MIPTVDVVLADARELYRDYLERKDHDNIVTIYNSIRPLPRGYKLQKKDAWCAAWVSVLGHISGMGERWVYECSAPQMLAAWKSRGRVSKDFQAIRPGDLVFYSWKKNGNADHVGIVTVVNGATVTVLEGNKSNACDYRSFKLPYSYLLAYARPAYGEVTKMQEASTWAKDAWKKACDKGVFDGTAPQGPITREQVAVVLDRLGLIK